jgi:ankyrin repeat protein
MAHRGAHHAHEKAPNSQQSSRSGNNEDDKKNIWWPALSAGDVDSVAALLAKGADANAKDPTFGWTPLIAACNSGKLTLVKLILDAGGKAAPTCNEGNTALHLAARNGHEDIVGFMLSKGKSDINAQNNNGWSALIWAAMGGHTQVVDVLCKASVNYNLADADGRTALMWAARHGHTGAVGHLLKKGIDLEVTDKAGLTVGDHAREYQELRVLLGVTKDLQDELLHAARQNDMEGVRRAIEAGINVNMKDPDGWTPIMWAAMHGSLDLVQLLLRHGANPDFADANGVSVKDLAPEHTAVREVLISTHGANERLLSCAKADDWDGVEQALHDGAWVNMQDLGDAPEESMRSALMWAARHGAVHHTLELASAKADLELRDKFGWTALLFAISNGHVGAVSVLHHLKANFKVKSFEGDRPLHMAVRADDAEMVQVLIAAGMSPDEPDDEKIVPTLVAANLGCSSSLQALLALGGSVSGTTKSKRTAMMLAAIKGHQRCIEVMIEKPSPLPRERMDEVVEGKSKKKIQNDDCYDEDSHAAAARRKHQEKQKKMQEKMKKHAGKDGDGPLAILMKARSKQEALEKKPVAPMKASEKLADIDSKNCAVLSHAIINGHLELVKYLLELHPNVDQADSAGNTPLIFAVLNADDKAALELLNAGASFLHRNAEKHKALDLAPTERLREMLKKREIDKKLKDDKDKEDGKDDKKAKSKGKAKAKAKEAKDEKEEQEPEEPEPADVATCEHRIRFEQLPTKLTEDMLEDFLRSLLKHLGTAEPKELKVIVDPITMGPRGHAYAGFQEARSKAAALKGDGKPYRGFAVRIFPEEKPAWR